MHTLHSIIYLILCVLTIKIQAAVLVPANVYDVVTTNFSKTCPALSQNSLVDSSTKYLSFCKDISLNKIPKRISMVEIDKYYCIGILAADFELCNVLSNNTYPYLPKSSAELDTIIAKIQKFRPNYLCDLLNNSNLFNDVNMNPSLIEPLSEFKQDLKGQMCPKLCSDLTGETSNEVCSIIFFIYDHIANISKIVAQKTPIEHTAENVPQTNPSNNTSNKKQSVVNVETPVISQTQITYQETPADIIGGNQNINIAPQNQKPGKSSVGHPDSNAAESAKKADHSTATAKPEAQITTLPPVAGETGNQVPNKLDTKATQNEAPKEQGENQLRTKIIAATNENPKGIVNDDKNEEILIDDKETTTLNTGVNDMKKQNSDPIDDYNDEGDEDDEGLKINEDTNSKAQKIQDQFASRVDTIPNMKDAIEDEESNFFSYFMFISVMFIAGYVIYHNKQKIMALVVEGRRDRNSRRRPSTSSYRKLNSNLEEAVTSKCSGSASHVIY